MAGLANIAVRCAINELARCGQTGLMGVQHNSPAPPNQEGNSFAALRQDFPEAAVRNSLKGRNPNRSLAAGVFDVSVAD